MQFPKGYYLSYVIYEAFHTIFRLFSNNEHPINSEEHVMTTRCHHPYLYNRGGYGSGAERTRISVFFFADPERTRIQFFSKKRIRIGSGSEFVSAPGNNLETKSALYFAETFGIHLKLAKKTLQFWAKSFFLFLCFCFGLHLKFEKMHNQSIVVLIDGQAAI